VGGRKKKLCEGKHLSQQFRLTILGADRTESTSALFLFADRCLATAGVPT
jgi:hypothetical protein